MIPQTKKKEVPQIFFSPKNVPSRISLSHSKGMLPEFFLFVLNLYVRKKITLKERKKKKLKGTRENGIKNRKKMGAHS